MSVVIYGPQGCGKTTNATALAAVYGKQRIVDDWTPGLALPRDALCLTNIQNVTWAIDFFNAMAHLRKFESSKNLKAG